MQSTFYIRIGTTDSNGLYSEFPFVLTCSDPISVNGGQYADAQDTELDVDADDGVLTNATNADGLSLTATMQTGPGDGTLTLNGDGSFSYMPIPASTAPIASPTPRRMARRLMRRPPCISPVYSTPVANDDNYTDVENQTLTKFLPCSVRLTDGPITMPLLDEYYALGDVPGIYDGGAGEDADDGTLNSGNVDWLYYGFGVTVIPVWNTTPDPSAYNEAANLGVTILVNEIWTRSCRKSRSLPRASTAACLPTTTILTATGSNRC